MVSAAPASPRGRIGASRRVGSVQTRVGDVRASIDILKAVGGRRGSPNYHYETRGELVDEVSWPASWTEADCIASHRVVNSDPRASALWLYDYQPTSAGMTSEQRGGNGMLQMDGGDLEKTLERTSRRLARRRNRFRPHCARSDSGTTASLRSSSSTFSERQRKVTVNDHSDVAQFLISVPSRRSTGAASC